MAPSRLATSALLAVILASGCTAGGEHTTVPARTPAPGPTPTPEASSTPDRPDPESFSRRRAMEHVRHLAGAIGPRTALSPEYERAARYVRDEFRSYGYRARLVPFELPRGTSWNVVARWPGSRPDVLLGAHLDTVPSSPGANDNASGVGVVLELARIYAGTRQALALRFVAFGAEERQPDDGHHYGSAAYVDTMDRPPRSMVSVDMIGKVETVIVGWMGRGKRRTVNRLLRSAEGAGVPASERTLPDVSDNGPFERAGIPSALLWTGREPNYHSPTDTPDNVAPRALGRIGRLLTRFIERETRES